ncbi:MAG: hypothetical protein SFW62_07095 [Alphaproteobacteria bacterium]|nr:hypothetical protein [Alphaproteobacteria bacterium]
MNQITYQDLVARYGAHLAFDLLLTIEKLAKIKMDIQQHDEDIRLQKALNALNDINFANNLESVA